MYSERNIDNNCAINQSIYFILKYFSLIHFISQVVFKGCQGLFFVQVWDYPLVTHVPSLLIKKPN